LPFEIVLARQIVDVSQTLSANGQDEAAAREEARALVIAANIAETSMGAACDPEEMLDLIITDPGAALEMLVRTRYDPRVPDPSLACLTESKTKESSSDGTTGGMAWKTAEFRRAWTHAAQGARPVDPYEGADEESSSADDDAAGTIDLRAHYEYSAKEMEANREARVAELDTISRMAADGFLAAKILRGIANDDEYFKLKEFLEAELTLEASTRLDAALRHYGAYRKCKPGKRKPGPDHGAPADPRPQIKKVRVGIDRESVEELLASRATLWERTFMPSGDTSAYVPPVAAPRPWCGVPPKPSTLKCDHGALCKWHLKWHGKIYLSTYEGCAPKQRRVGTMWDLILRAVDKQMDIQREATTNIMAAMVAPVEGAAARIEAYSVSLHDVELICDLKRASLNCMTNVLMARQREVTESVDLSKSRADELAKLTGVTCFLEAEHAAIASKCAAFARLGLAPADDDEKVKIHALVLLSVLDVKLHDVARKAVESGKVERLIVSGAPPLNILNPIHFLYFGKDVDSDFAVRTWMFLAKKRSDEIVALLAKIKSTSFERRCLRKGCGFTCETAEEGFGHVCDGNLACLWDVVLQFVDRKWLHYCPGAGVGGCGSASCLRSITGATRRAVDDGETAWGCAACACENVAGAKVCVGCGGPPVVLRLWPCPTVFYVNKHVESGRQMNAHNARSYKRWLYGSVWE